MAKCKIRSTAPGIFCHFFVENGVPERGTVCVEKRSSFSLMSTLPSPKDDDEADVSAVMVGSLALFFSLVIVALVYLSDYSIGHDFADQKPHFNGSAHLVAESE